MAIVKVAGRRARRKAVLSAYNTLAYAMGAYFQQAREQRNLDQEDVATLAKMNQTQVSWIETGRWENTGSERLREYIQAVKLPNESALIEVVEGLDTIAANLPKALA